MFQDRARNWAVLAAYFSETGLESEVWLDDFITSGAMRFDKVSAPRSHMDWHHKVARRTSGGQWLDHMAHARKAMAARPDGLITVFPQLAMCAGLLKRFSRHKPAIVAYNFNLGTLQPGPRQRLARFVAPQIDRFVVHAPSEIASYAAYLDVPEHRMEFVPVQRGELPFARDEECEQPFILAMGSAHRDYPTLIEALAPLGIRTLIVARKDIIDTLPKAPHLEYLHGLSQEDCLRLTARARLSVTPISNMETASGQVTFVNAMRMGVPVIATRCPGTDGYIADRATGVLCKPFDALDLRLKIKALWQDGMLRRQIAQAGQQEAARRFSDPAVAARLERILLEVSGSVAAPSITQPDAVTSPVPIGMASTGDVLPVMRPKMRIVGSGTPVHAPKS